MEKVAAGLQPRFRFKAACWRKREGSCSGSGRLLEVCDCNCVCVIVSLCDCVCVIVFWEWEAPRAGEMKRIWRRWFASTQFVGRGPFPKIVLKVSTDCVLCPKKTFLRILCSVFLSEDCVRLNLLVCLFPKIVLKVSNDCVLYPQKNFLQTVCSVSEYCVHLWRLY